MDGRGGRWWIDEVLQELSDFPVEPRFYFFFSQPSVRYLPTDLKAFGLALLDGELEIVVVCNAIVLSAHLNRDTASLNAAI